MANGNPTQTTLSAIEQAYFRSLPFCEAQRLVSKAIKRSSGAIGRAMEPMLKLEIRLHAESR